MADMRMQLVLDLREKVLEPLKRIRGGSQEAAQALKSTRDQLRDLDKVQQDVNGLRTTRIQLRGQQRDLQELQSKLSGHNAGLQDQQARHRQIVASLKTSRESHARLTKAMQEGAAVTPEFSRQLEIARVALLSSQGAYERSKASIGKYGTQIKNTQRDIGQLTGKIASGQERLQGYERRLQDAGMGTDRLGAKSRSLKSQMDTATAAMEKQKQALASLKAQQDRVAALKEQHGKAMKHTGMMVATGVGMVAAGRTMARPVKATLGTYAEQENASTQLRASMMQADGGVSAEFTQIDALAKRLGDRLPGTTADFVNMMTVLRKEGISAQAILGGTGEAAALLGVQLEMPVVEAAAFAAKIQDATQATEGEMLGLMDMLQKNAYLGADQNYQLSGITKMAGAMSLLRKKGVDAYKDLSPLLVMMNQAGMTDGASAGNAIDKIFAAGLNGKKLQKTNAMLSGKGIKLNFADKQGKFAGIENLFKQLDKLKALGDNDILKTAVLSELFGTDAQNMQVLRNFMAKGFDGYKETTAKMDAQASLQQRVESQLGTLSNVMEAAQGGFTNVMASIGETVQGDAKGIINWIGEITSSIGAWVKEHPGITAAIVRTVAALATLTAGLGLLLVPLALFVGKVMLVRFAFGMLGVKLPGIIAALRGLTIVFMRLGLAMLTTPLGWFIIAAAAMGTAAYFIYKNWEPITQFFSSMWQTIASTIGSAWQSITATLANAWAQLLAGATGIWQRLRGMISGALLSIGAAIVNWSPAALLHQAFAAAMAYLGFELPARFTEFGSNILQGLANGITSRLGAVREAIGGAADSAIGWFKEKLGIHSPSRVFMAAGANVGEGAALGIGSTSDMVRKSAAAMAAAAAVSLPAAALAIPAVPGMPYFPALPAVSTIAPQAEGMQPAPPEAIRIDRRPPLAANWSPRPAPIIQGDTITLQIHAAPGMDEHAIARMVTAELERRERTKAARAQSAFYDWNN
ncbi:phage tail tape measure protein [Comamonas antarctica]|uniref:Phage tail tape measure protein n=1 Tax=Comamonas antarctica TaxID=2743470 RepID=A0A6N1X058_9BURK|nr:phage tail tape measure protein [Comamonas antarctica]QKV52637.1 phage tail tape measure protein [Comamonas antarctica]